MSEIQNIKCVFVGDGGTGKTCMLIRMTTGKFAETCPPTVFDSYSYPCVYKDNPVMLSVSDTGGIEDYDRLRPLSYPQSQIVVLVFSLVNPASYKNINSKWHQEITQHLNKVPMILVGTKSDLRNDPETIERLKNSGQTPISYTQGLTLAKELKAVKYLECSSSTDKDLKPVLDAICQAALFTP